MRTRPFRMVAPEGKGIVLGLFVGAVIMASGGVLWDFTVLKSLSILGFILFGLGFYFFRDPERSIPVGKNLILSPADGKVVYVGRADDSRTSDLRQKVSIFLSLFDVHVNRVPVSGKVTGVKYKHGRFVAAFRHEASDVNEQTEVRIKVGDKTIQVKQIAGVVARRILCYLREGDQVVSGARFGFIRFGSRVELIVPENARIDVHAGSRVRGGESIIGELQ